ncbi:MAG: SPOR domain-containing protein [Bacteroidales bacterium]|jgi:nucleoid DNA-binding protein
MEVNQAIRKLLFLEDCVIIPGFGGFVSHYKPAVIDQATGTFIPPTKEIVFNRDLIQNDGTLVSCIALNDGVSNEQARKQIDEFVVETRKKLDSNESVFIDGIGQFVQGRNHEIRFEADAGTNLFLDSFGLSSFRLRQLTHDPPSTAKSAVNTSREESPRTVEFAIEEIKRSAGHRNLRRVAIAMPLLIAFSLLPLNSRISDTLISSRASMVPEPSLFRLNYPDAIVKDTATMIVFPIADSVGREDVRREGIREQSGAVELVKTSEVKTEETKAAEVKAVEVKQVVGKYSVIAGCFKIKENADRLHKQLIEKGYPASIAISKNGLLYKVSVQTFASRDEALSGLARIKAAEPGMQLWAAI